MIRKAFAIAVLLACAAGQARAAAPFQIDGNVGLSALVALSDGRLQTLSQTLETLATNPEVAAGDWNATRAALRQAEALGLPGLLLFAKPDGSYWTVAGGKQSGNVAHRPYFQKAMSGQTSIGDLVVSQSTGKPQTVVAVPVKNANGTVVGVLAGTVFLDEFSVQLKRELGIGSNLVFWAIDGSGKIAVHSDPSNVFVEPGTMSPALAKVRDEMLSHEEGTLTYEYRGAQRSVVYRRSPISGWRYGFGIVRGK